MSKVLVFGHKNPDTDTITSALVYAHLKRALGQEVEPVRLGEVSGETQYVLDFFGVEAPRYVDQVSTEATEVALVDHNEFQQSAPDIKNVKIVEVIDHHRIANFETAEPLSMRVEPLGCTATILRKMFIENGVDIPREIAGLMLSAILSDTLLLKSPTCTDQDVEAAHALAELANVDYKEYGMNMLKAGSSFEDTPLKEVITLDSKVFSLGGKQVEVAQVNSFDPEFFLNQKEALEEEIQQTIQAKGLSSFLFLVTNVVESSSYVLAFGEDSSKVADAFNVTLENDTALLEGVVSRKKQVIPALEKAYA